jgi:hypothetical protein
MAVPVLGRPNLPRRATWGSRYIATSRPEDQDAHDPRRHHYRQDGNPSGDAYPVGFALAAVLVFSTTSARAAIVSAYFKFARHPWDLPVRD